MISKAQPRLLPYNEGAVTPANLNPGYTPLQVAWRRRWTVLATVILCLGAAFVYVMKATPIYTSTSKVYVEQTGPQILGDATGLALKQTDSYLYNQAALLKSTPILTSAVDVTGARRMKTFKGVDNIVTKLKKELEVSVGKQDDLITVAFDSPYPEEAAALVNGIVEEYVRHQTKKKQSSAFEVLSILQTWKDKNDKELSDTTKELVAFKQTNGTLSFAGSEGKGNIILERLAKLSDALTQAQLATFEAEAAYQAAKQMISDPALVTRMVEAQQSHDTNHSDKEYGELLAELRKNQSDRLSLRERGVIRNSATDELDARIEFLKGQIAEREGVLAQAYVASLDQARQVAQAKERDIRGAFEQQKKEALDLNTQSAKLASLESDVKRSEELSDSLNKRIKEISVDASANEKTGSLNISVLETARPEDKPTSPNKPRAMALALVMGLMLGLAGAFTREWTDHRLRTADEVGAALQLPVLGVVPHMGGKFAISERGQQVRLQPMSETAEAYRTIRTAVFFAAPGEEMKTILVTSPAPGDGKTTSASNLAISLAQAGHRTLLLDADFRKPSQHKIFKIDDKVGLSNVIAGQVKLREAVRQTETPGLYVLPCGPVPPNPSEILNGKRFAQVMEVLCNAFDRIVLDSPPVMPVTDARILAASADLTILVLRADKSTERMSRHARDGLLSVNANILGVVVNDMSKRKREGFYGYGYGGYYGRGEGEGKASAADVVVEPAVGPNADLESRALQLQPLPGGRRRDDVEE
jgi:capsular exopolysaccharide synthesis family protein